MPTPLDQAKVTSLKGVGPALADKLARIGITTLADVLFHLPLRYEDRTKVTPIGALIPGVSALIEGKVIACDVAFGRRRSLMAKIQDNTGTLTIRFYHFSKAQQANLKSLGSIRCFGDVRRGAAGVEMYHPEYESDIEELDTRLTPIYPTTEGLAQPRIRKIIQQVLELMGKGQLVQTVGKNFTALARPDINAALHTAHTPGPEEDVEALIEGTHPALQRLAFEELLAHHLSLRQIKQQNDLLPGTAFSDRGESLQGSFLDYLSFTLTGAQARVVQEIYSDLEKPHPMLRLVQGDVGSGKTVVAAFAALKATANHFQTAIMAPTEILSEQHFLNFYDWLTPLGIQVTWLTGKTKGKKRSETLGLIESGTAQVVIGTHALFQESVQFKNLGLLIIDEQHKFGVQQRLELLQKGNEGLTPHQLVMTATPIPRTLTMSMYADMNVSVIDELPPGRMPITTTVLPDSKRAAVTERVAAACKSGSQAYWVCTLIDESEVMQCQAAEVTASELKEALPDLRVGLIHGRMKPQEKVEVMADFKSGKIQLLVATTVIEVGVDVPNATLMIIENSERLGLAQLHQLRGRIGRGDKESFCVLLYQTPVGNLSKQRLNVMRETQDGFIIAERDLQIRGPGEIFGNRQSGEAQFKIADLIRDAGHLTTIRQLADEILAKEPETARALTNRWLVRAEAISQV